MAFNISKFRDAFNKTQYSTSPVASPAYFEVYFEGPPNCLGTGTLVDQFMQGMQFRASAADLPGRQLMGMQRQPHGPKRTVPHSTMYAGAVIEFIETEGYDIRRVFDAWHDAIEGTNRFGTNLFYDDIISKALVIRGYTKSGLPIGQWKLKDVFPIAINPSQMNWSTQSGFITVPIEFHYHKWEYEHLLHKTTDLVYKPPGQYPTQVDTEGRPLPNGEGSYDNTGQPVGKWPESDVTIMGPKVDKVYSDIAQVAGSILGDFIRNR